MRVVVILALLMTAPMWAAASSTAQDKAPANIPEARPVLEDFFFEYTGGEDAGYVTVTHKGKTMPALRVVKERTDWKVGER